MALPKLRQAFDILNILLTDSNRDEMRSQPWNCGQWVRNILHLWEVGVVDEFVSEIMSIPNHTKYTLEYKLPGEPNIVDGVDYGLLHPDNCSTVIIAMYLDYIDGGLKL